MRPVQLADIEVASRVLLAVPAVDRAAVMSDILDRAALADTYRQNTGRPHPVYGVGSLMSAASAYTQVPRPGYLDQNALNALSLVIRGLLAEMPHQTL